MPVKTKFLLIGFAIFNIAIHLYFGTQLEYHRDELLYFSLGKHLDFGYFSIPPLTAWLAALTTKTIGTSVLSVKVLPALLSGGFIFLIAGIVKELDGNLFSLILACMLFMFAPVFMRAGILFQPVPFDIFFWTLIIYLIIKYVNQEKASTLFYIGTAIGLALLNKYLIALLLLSILITLPFTSQRKLFVQRNFYTCLLIAFIIFTPNLIWQWTNDFPVFHHMSELNETQLQQVNRFGFIKDQFFNLNIGFVISIIGFGYFLFHPLGKKYRLIAIASALSFAILLFLRGKSYYIAGIYPALFAAGAVYIEQKTTRPLFKNAIIVFVLLLCIPFIPYGLPVASPEKLVTYYDWLEDKGMTAGRSFEDGTKEPLPQDYADMIGWNELAQYTRKAYELASNKNALAIYADEYCYAGAVFVIGEQYRLPEPISFSDNFIYWAPQKFDPDLEHLIYINGNLGEDIEALFDDIVLVGSIENPLAREFGAQVYLCSKPNRPFNNFWAEVLDFVEGE